MHTDGPDCLSCDLKLKQAHPYLSNWFTSTIKPAFPLAHISWSYRGKDDQEAAFAQSKSKLHYPNSAHNWMENGQPCALAIDLFVLDQGIASWPGQFFVDVNALSTDCMLWGGNFRTLGDRDHWQLDPSKLPKAV